MSVEDHDDELATQYVLARRLRPDLDGPELAQRRCHQVVLVSSVLTGVRAFRHRAGAGGTGIVWRRHPQPTL